MELKQGYKRTDVGVIPDEWQRKRVAEIASPTRNAIVGGPFGSDLVSRDYTNLGVPVIRGQNMGGRWVSGNFVFVSVAKAHSLEANLARSGDIVFTQRGTLGQVSVLPDKPYGRYLVSQSQMKVTVDREIADALFVYYVFIGEKHQEIIRQNTIQTSLPHINLSILRNIPLQVPRLPEQRVIAAALGDVDDLISALDQLIAKKRDLKQAAMQQLLTGKQRLPSFGGTHPGYRQTELGVIPNDWNVVKLNDCLAYAPDYGINAPAVPFSEKLPTYIRITDITEDGRFSRENPVCVKGTDGDKYYLNEGELVFARTGASVGKSYLYDPEDGTLAFAGFLIRIRPNPTRLVPAYLAAYVTTGPYWNWVHLMSMRSGQPGINGNEYRQLPILLPPTIEEQRAIANILSDMDAEIAALEQRRDKIRALKQGMMQELLTGRTRLI